MVSNSRLSKIPSSGINTSPATIANSVVVFFTFLLSVPAMIMPSSRGWLKIHGYMTVVCAAFTMSLGLVMWFETLKTRTELFNIWTQQSAATQSLIQQEVRNEWKRGSVLS